MLISFKAARINAGLSGDKASKALGIHRETLYNYEKGKHMPNSQTLVDMAKLYGCAVEDFREVNNESEVE
jgi:DNA-binding XRE family transcriptional regulator